MSLYTRLRRMLHLDGRPSAIEHAPVHRVTAPSRAARVAARAHMLAYSQRRQGPGTGSDLRLLRTMGGKTMRWWQSAIEVIADGGTKVAVAGAVAANSYMPPRQTGDLDLAVAAHEIEAAERSLRMAGWKFVCPLSLYGGLTGSAWIKSEHPLDLLGLPEPWGIDALAAAQKNRASHGLPTLTLEYLVVMKLISARPQDSADIARMLGAASPAQIDRVRRAARQVLPDEIDVLDQMIALGKLEYGG